MSFQHGCGRIRCEHDWVMVTAPPAALQAAQASTADAQGQASQLGIRNSMHVLARSLSVLPLLSASQLSLPESRTARCLRAG